MDRSKLAVNLMRAASGLAVGAVLATATVATTAASATDRPAAVTAPADAAAELGRAADQVARDVVDQRPTPAAELTPYLTQRPAWRKCAVADECAQIAVPLDYRRPRGPRINIAVSRLRAKSPEQRLGVLLFNPGGPGAPGLDMPKQLAGMSKRLDSAYDRIGFDPRGAGRSTPIRCLPDRELTGAPAPDPLPRTPAQVQAYERYQRHYADACFTSSGRTLPYLTTENTARDMDVVRAALGERRINFLGYSYGTYLGAVYATLFPSRVGRFVLDSAVNPDWVWRRQFMAQGPAFERRLADFFAWAAQRDRTYRLGTTAEQVRGFWAAVRAEAVRRPLAGDKRRIGPSEFDMATSGGLYNRATFPFLAKGLAEYRAKRVAVKLTKLLDPEDAARDTFAGVFTAVTCNEAVWPRSLQVYRTQAKLQGDRYPFIGWSSAGVGPCAFWRSTPVRPVQVSGRGLPPVLVVQSRFDPATPYPGGRRLAGLLGGRLLMAAGGDHGLTGFNVCVTEAVVRYLGAGELPATGTTCPDRYPDERLAERSADSGAAPVPFRPALPPKW